MHLKEVSIQKAKHMDKYQATLKPNKYSYLNEIHTKHKLKSQKTDIPDVQVEYLDEERGRHFRGKSKRFWTDINAQQF